MTVTLISSNGPHNEPLVVRAQSLFPERPYLEQSAVTHARAGWIKAVWILRNHRRWGELYSHDTAAGK